MTNTLPESMVILGHKIKIRESPNPENHGLSDVDTLTIYVDPDRPETDIMSTLFHETVHMVLALSGMAYLFDDRTEEAIVRCLEHALWPLVQFRNNALKKRKQ